MSRSVLQYAGTRTDCAADASQSICIRAHVRTICETWTSIFPATSWSS